MPAAASARPGSRQSRLLEQAAGQVPLVLSSKHLVRDLDDQLAAHTAANSDSTRNLDGLAYSSIGCTPPRPSKFGDGDLFPAFYDSTPAVLALRPPADGRQQADVLDCGTAVLLASASITPR